MIKFHFFSIMTLATQTLKKIRTPWPWLGAELVLTRNGDGDLSALACAE
jgi:hypothetical protein